MLVTKKYSMATESRGSLNVFMSECHVHQYINIFTKFPSLAYLNTGKI